MNKLTSVSVALIAGFILGISGNFTPVFAAQAVEQSTSITAKNLVDSGNRKSDRGDLRGAIALYQQALEIQPTYARAFFNLGSAYCQLNDFAASKAAFTQAIRLAPEDSEAWAGRGIAHLELGQIDSSISDFDRSIQLDQKQWRAWWGRGQAYFRSSSLAEAEHNLTQAISLNPNNPLIYLDRGNTYLIFSVTAQPPQQKTYQQRAIADLTKATQLRSNLATAFNTRGFIYAQAGQKQAAIRDFQQAAKLYEAQDQPESAKAALEQIRSLN